MDSSTWSQKGQLSGWGYQTMYVLLQLLDDGWTPQPGHKRGSSLGGDTKLCMCFC
jgi:hypothetical protein